MVNMSLRLADMVTIVCCTIHVIVDPSYSRGWGKNYCSLINCPEGRTKFDKIDEIGRLVRLCRFTKIHCTIDAILIVMYIRIFHIILLPMIWGEILQQFFNGFVYDDNNNTSSTSWAAHRLFSLTRGCVPMRSDIYFLFTVSPIHEND